MLFKRRRSKDKIFVIGQNKTGTTSMLQALDMLGYKVGDQAEAEGLIEDWARRDFRQIIKYCDSADAFQDVPFSLHHTYQALDQAFPAAKFILTVRSSSEQWYQSVIRFHTKIVGKDRIPTAADMKEFAYRWKGWAWRTMELIYGITDEQLYDKDIFIRSYETHNYNVQDYFRHRPGKLLILNVEAEGAEKQLCEFLGRTGELSSMPHLNSSTT